MGVIDAPIASRASRLFAAPEITLLVTMKQGEQATQRHRETTKRSTAAVAFSARESPAGRSHLFVRRVTAGVVHCSQQSEAAFGRHAVVVHPSLRLIDDYAMRLPLCRAITHLLQSLLVFCYIHVYAGATNAASSHGDETFLTKEDFDNAKHADFVGDGVTLSPADFANGLKLRDDELYTGKQFKLYSQSNFRGDIRGSASWSLDTKGVHRNGVMHQRKVWVNGRIPYVISNQYNHRERALLARAMEEYHRRTCIRFEPRSALDNDYLYIGKIDGCFSDVGRAGGRQELSLDDGCLEYDTAIHELMHAVGFYHEHERWDRDEFINILWQNIDRAKQILLCLASSPTFVSQSKHFCCLTRGRVGGGRE
uniref:Metalloendopeptidase n=1 Tax=Plectus sambesii TaxID=2011161 RepID=A0A914W0V9_9BILA